MDNEESKQPEQNEPVEAQAEAIVNPEIIVPLVPEAPLNGEEESELTKSLMRVVTENNEVGLDELEPVDEHVRDYFEQVMSRQQRE